MIDWNQLRFSPPSFTGYLLRDYLAIANLEIGLRWLDDRISDERIRQTKYWRERNNRYNWKGRTYD